MSNPTPNLIEYAAPHRRPPRRPYPRWVRALLRGLGMLYWLGVAGFVLFAASLCGFPLGMPSVGAAGVFLAIVLLPFLAVAMRAVRRRRAGHVLNYLEQATRAGLPLTTMLEAAQRAETGAMRVYLADLVGLLHDGVPLGMALEMSVPGIPRRWVRLIDAGERIGDLPRTLRRLVVVQRRGSAALPAADTSWWIYPLAVLVVTVLVVAMIMVFVMPKFEQIFRDFGTKLPPVTVALLKVSRWVANDYGWAFVLLLPIALVMLAVAEALRQTLRPPRAEPAEVQPLSEQFLEMLPSPLGVLHRDRALADVCHVMSDALSAGQTLETALQESREVSGSGSLRRKLDEWLTGIRGGQTPAEAARAARMPELVSGTVAAAQVGGRLDEGMAFLARHYGTKFSRGVLLLRGALVPLQTILLGGLVLFIVLALMMPLMALIEAVGAVALKVKFLTHRRRGFFALEMTIGLILLIGTAILLAVTASQHRTATRRLDDSRAAMRLAEEAMTALQLGEELPEPSKPDALTVERLPDASRVPGTAWARVRTTVRGRSAELVGLVPGSEAK